MRVGVGLPATVPGASGSLIVEWARRADSGPFSSVAVLDRLLYDNYEPLVSLAAAAAVTRRVRLATTIVIAPLRNSAVLAKQAASLQALSGGRLVLGLGLGARQDDYEMAEMEYRARGRRLTQQVAQIRDHWERGGLAPRGGGSRPRLLVGGSGGLGLSRMARYADGYVHNGGPPRAFARAAAEATAAWTDLCRPDKPELWGMAYFALGDDAVGNAYLRDYYAFTGPFAERIAAGLLTTAEELMEFVEGYREAGCDELILFPAVGDLEQLDRLEYALGGAGALESERRSVR